MDKTFIKMCDCEEIQTEHEYVDGDLYSEKCHYRDGMTAIFNEFYCSECDRELKLDRAKWIWLPRQDQLQEMILSDEVLPELIVQDKLAHFAMWVRYQCHYPFTSMEQLWLAFVQKALHNKTWDGEKWNALLS